VDVLLDVVDMMKKQLSNDGYKSGFRDGMRDKLRERKMNATFDHKVIEEGVRVTQEDVDRYSAIMGMTQEEARNDLKGLYLDVTPVAIL